MKSGPSLVRKSFFLDPEKLSKAAELMGAASEAEALRKIISRYVEQERFWQWMKKTAGKAGKRDFGR